MKPCCPKTMPRDQMHGACREYWRAQCAKAQTTWRKKHGLPRHGYDEEKEKKQFGISVSWQDAFLGGANKPATPKTP